ncbi:hypothetical protein IWQ51_006833 [Labrenzia sp. EL_142]|nr:hypothetical protein [Labrenzia sp. EL_142]
MIKFRPILIRETRGLRVFNRRTEMRIFVMPRFIVHLANKSLVTVLACLGIMQASICLGETPEKSLAPNSSSAENESLCNLVGDKSIHQPSLLKLHRDSEVVADVEMRSSNLPFSKIKWRTEPKVLVGSLILKYEYRDDTSEKNNFIFFSFKNIKANGFIIIKNYKNISAAKLFHENKSSEKIELSIEYHDLVDVDHLLLDLSCIIEEIRDES